MRRGFRRKAIAAAGRRLPSTFRARSAMTPARVRRIAQKVISPELKVRDLSISLVDIPTITGNVSILTNGVAIAQGDAFNERNGNWIQPKVIHGKVYIQGTVANALETSEFRILLCQWHEDQSVNACTLVKVMDDTGDPLQGYDIQNKGQFKILWSRTGLVSNDSSNSQHQKYFKFSVKPPKKILYDAATDKNFHLFMIAYSSDAAAADPPQYRFSIRLRYTDS